MDLLYRETLCVQEIEPEICDLNVVLNARRSEDAQHNYRSFIYLLLFKFSKLKLHLLLLSVWEPPQHHADSCLSAPARSLSSSPTLKHTAGWLSSSSSPNHHESKQSSCLPRFSHEIQHEWTASWGDSSPAQVKRGLNFRLTLNSRKTRILHT